MSGITDLTRLIASMSPKLDADVYVFVTTTAPKPTWFELAKGSFVEAEGTTLILEQQRALALGFAPSALFACISLEVHSSLEAVGLTAAFATALATANISANVVAGYYHDHIFVAQADAQNAMDVLTNLSQRS
jgi:hypothetical protein